MKVQIYVEGGPLRADAEGLRNFRKAFKQHFERLDPRLRSLEVIARGSTDQTITAYSKGILQNSSGNTIALLVDSDAPVTAKTPAAHLQSKLDAASVPPPARSNVFLMVQCMESWFITDTAALQHCFGREVRLSQLPQHQDIEAVLKNSIISALEAAVKSTPSKRYHKVHHGSRILGVLDPVKVALRSRHARDLHEFLRASV